MDRNLLYLLIGVLAVAALFFGYLFYQQQQTSGLQIDVGDGSVSIETNEVE